MLRPACLAALAGLVCGPLLATSPATADLTDGTLTVTVVVDDDASGGYDPEVDRPQPGVPVTVTDATGHAVTATTDDGGRVLVPAGEALVGGRYFVTAELPPELGVVPAVPSGSFTAFSSTVDVSTENRSVVLGVVTRPPAEPSPGEPSATPEPPAESRPAAPAPARSAVAAPLRFAVGDRVWDDRDGDGRQDEDEGGAGGVSAQLLDGDGVVLASTTTGPAGRYLFDDLPAGSYAIRFAGLSPGSKLSPRGVGGPAQDSDPDDTGVTPNFILGVGERGVRTSAASDGVQAGYLHAGVDAGVAPLRFAIASVVWQDTSGDGVLDPSEPAGSARVMLLRGREGDQVVASTSTDDQGRYLFTDLAAGTYRVRFSDLGAHRRLTRARVGPDPAVQSAPDPATATSDPVRLEQGSAGLVPGGPFGQVGADFVLASVNAGTVGSYTITDRVWSDTDADGLLDPGEPGVPGVRVELVDADGTVVATTTTGTGGRYTLEQLAAGRYRLRFPALPPGLHFTVPSVGSDPATDSDVYGNAQTAPVAVGADNPVESRVAAGLTTSAVDSETAAPPLVPRSSPTATPAGVGLVGSVGSEGPPTGLLLAALVLVAAGVGAVTYTRLRRP